MVKYILASLITGLSFAFMDGLIYGNSYAAELMQPFAPIAKTAVNMPLGVAIDLVFGFVISAIFVIDKPAIPFRSGIMKGLVYGLGMWFFRVLMGVVSYWMLFEVPATTLLYLAITGLFEMLILGVINGLFIRNHTSIGYRKD